MPRCMYNNKLWKPLESHQPIHLLNTHITPLPVKPVMRLQRNFCCSPFLSSLRGNAHDQSFTHPHSTLIPHCRQMLQTKRTSAIISCTESNRKRKAYKSLQLPLHLPGVTPTGLQILTALSPPSFKCLNRRSYNWHHCSVQHTHTHTHWAKGKEGSRVKVQNFKQVMTLLSNTSIHTHTHSTLTCQIPVRGNHTHTHTEVNNQQLTQSSE